MIVGLVKYSTNRYCEYSFACIRPRYWLRGFLRIRLYRQLLISCLCQQDILNFSFYMPSHEMFFCFFYYLQGMGNKSECRSQE